MIENLAFAFSTSIMITFIYVIFNWDGMLLSKAGSMAEHKLPWLIAKPVITCHVCMASFWGILFWMIEGHSVLEIIPLVKFLFTVGGMNVIISCFIGPKHYQEEFNGG